ncbi:hypothetical protein Droror1_Dr00027664 [Drosera rotundifolia]
MQEDDKLSARVSGFLHFWVSRLVLLLDFSIARVSGFLDFWGLDFSPPPEVEIDFEQIQLKTLAEEIQAVSKGLEKVELDVAVSENDGVLCWLLQGKECRFSFSVFRRRSEMGSI